MYDVAIIGAGICGCALLYELSRYKNSVILLEKENDVSMGTTKANSAIVHAGYDPVPGTLMARANVAGNELVRELCKKLDVPYKQTGSLVLALQPENMATLNELYERGIKNGVPGLRLLTADETLRMEPNLAPDILGALFAPSAGIVSPWELTLALAETAVRNGAEVALNSPVTAIEQNNDCFAVTAGGRKITARYVVNAAGVYADRIAGLVGDTSFQVTPAKGEYLLLDKNQGTLVSHIIFQCPSRIGKGVLISPTVHGNLIVGPNAVDSERGDLSTTADGLEFVRKTAVKSVPSVNFRDCIRTFAGLRANTEASDFIVSESPACRGFFHMAGIKSPGLTAAPALARELVSLLHRAGLGQKEKPDAVDTRTVMRFREMTARERSEAVRENPLFGKIVCRCETVTEAEVIETLHSPIPPVSVDGVKRRCGCGMGRCQGGFCGPRVQELIARESGRPIAEIPLDREGMWILSDQTKQTGTIQPFPEQEA